MSKNQIPLQLQAAAELELRRRQRERAGECFMCDFIEVMNEVYENGEGRPVCIHSKNEQDPNSYQNQKAIADLKKLYGNQATI